MKLNALVVDLSVLGRRRLGLPRAGLPGCCPGLGHRRLHPASTVAQRVRGLRLGADDWVTKPAHPEEVVARIEAVVRRRKRSQPKADAGPVVAGELEIRADQFQAFVCGGASTSPAASSSCSRSSPRPPARCSSARTSISASGATRWPTATARSTSSSASCARSSQKDSPAGTTSTPTSASATASSPSRTTGRRPARPRRSRTPRPARRPTVAEAAERFTPGGWFLPRSQLFHRPPPAVTSRPGAAATLLPSTQVRAPTRAPRRDSVAARTTKREKQ